MQRLQRAAVEELMDGRPNATLEAALEVFEVFASGSLTATRTRLFFKR